MEINEEKLKKVAERYGLRLLLLFGSRVAETGSGASDFDIAYLSTRTLGLDEESQLIVDLAPLVRSEAVDLVDLKKASPLLLFAITRACRILYAENPLVFPELASYAFKQYVEAKPLFELKEQILKARL